MEIYFQLAQRCLSPGAGFLDYLPGLRHGRPLTTGRPGLTIPAFSRAMLASRSPSELGVVVADAGNDRHQRSADIGGIETPAQTDLHHGRLRSPPGKVQKAQGGGDLEKCANRRARIVGRQSGFGLANFFQVGRQFARRDRVTIDLDTFLDAAQMGRGE